MIDKFKKALQARIDLMLDCAYKVALQDGYTKDKDTFLVAVRDALNEADGKDKEE